MTDRHRVQRIRMKYEGLADAMSERTRRHWAAVESIAPKIGCVPQTLLEWVKRVEVDAGKREGLSSTERERIKALERENKELRRANEILKTASAFFAQAELDRQLKR